MRRVLVFLRRHLFVIFGALVLLAVVLVLWLFSAPIAEWLRFAQSFDAVAFLGEHLLAVGFLGVCLLILVLIWLPKWQAARLELTPQARFEVENNARKTLAEIVGGAAFLMGLYFTWSSLEVNREGQVTERFTKAIDQLGAVNDKGEKQLEVRLGGIYALERIARDSKKDHWPIMEILTRLCSRKCAFIEGHAAAAGQSFLAPPHPAQKDEHALQRRPVSRAKTTSAKADPRYPSCADGAGTARPNL